MGQRTELYGKKHEIELVDGCLVVKVAGPNLKITEPARSKATA